MEACGNVVNQARKFVHPSRSTMTSFVSAVSQSGSHVSNGSSDNSLWYICLSYMSEKGLDILSKRGLFGNHKVKPLQFYEHCVYGKQHQTKFPKVMHTTKAMLDYVDSNC